MLSRFPTLYPSLSHTHSVCLSTCPVCVCVFVLCVLVRTRCAQCSVGTLHCLPALVPGSGEGTALSRSPSGLWLRLRLSLCSRLPAYVFALWDQHASRPTFLTLPLLLSLALLLPSLSVGSWPVCVQGSLYIHLLVLHIFFTFAFYL